MPVSLTHVTALLSAEHDLYTTCYERPPVLRDRFCWAEWVVAQDRLYCIYGPTVIIQCQYSIPGLIISLTCMPLPKHDNHNHLLALPLSCGVPAAATILLQPVLSWTSSFVVPIALMSRLTQSIHLCFGLPLLLHLPGGTISSVCLPTYSWCCVFTCANHLVAFLPLSVLFSTFSLYLCYHFSHGLLYPVYTTNRCRAGLVNAH